MTLLYPHSDFPELSLQIRGRGHVPRPSSQGLRPVMEPHEIRTRPPADDDSVLFNGEIGLVTVRLHELHR